MGYRFFVDLDYQIDLAQKVPPSSSQSSTFIHFGPSLTWEQ
jgi:hypothetical protein